MSSKNPENIQSLEDIYKKRNMHEAVLKEPDMWMGSIHLDKKELWVYDDDNQCMIKKEVEYIPGLYKIYDEILVNARDQTIRDKTCKTIKVNIDKKTGMIKVWNDGQGIPVEIHKEYNIFVPELIFANLLTSANYDKKGKTTGGKNGLGAKLANIYSTEFHINIVDSKNKKSYSQICEDNMYKINKPIIKNSNETSFIEIGFIPDYKKFKLTELTDDHIALFKKRVYDIAGCTNKNVKVFLNDKEIKIRSFEDYVGMFYNKNNLVYEEINNRWRVGAIFDPSSGFNQISFVNGISTFQGGTHVAYITEQICKKIIDYIKSKFKKVNVKPSHVRENLTIFIDCVIEDPSFNSQTKEFLGSKVSDYGSSCEITDNFIKKLTETGLIDEVVRLAQFKEESELKRSDGKKVASLNDVPKYQRAKWAGTRKSKYCRLILTEGDSAKSFALSGLEVIGREKYGVFPLKGKPINVREATVTSIKNNTEFTYIKKILGLKQGKKYTDVSKLRYGGIVILTDQDSVTSDTPLLLRKNNLVEIRTIDNLTNNWNKNLNNKEYGTSDYEIWTDNGWTKIKSVIRHKVNKQIYRVLTHTGVVDVTEDHSLLDVKGNEIAPKDCQLQMELMHNFPKFEDNKIDIPDNLNHLSVKELWNYASQAKIQYYQSKTKNDLINILNSIKNTIHYQFNQNLNINEEEAYVMGLFFADGTAGINKPKACTFNRTLYNWNIANTNMNYLNKCKLCMEKIYTDLQFNIIEDKSNNKKENKKIFKLIINGGIKTESVVRKYRELFYDKDMKKKIPLEILNSCKLIRENFFNGFYDGDGDGDGDGEKIHKNGCKIFDIDGKIGAHGLYFLCKSLGYEVSINHNVNKPKIYTLTITKDTLQYPSNKIIKIIPLDVKDVYVYDLETENHHFQAGIGSLIVHNTDGSHIKGLIINMLHRFWPSLLKINGFVQSMATPIIKVFKKSDAKKKDPKIFYTITDYKNWIDQVGSDISKWSKPKYYKGLGTSTEKEAKECFNDFENKVINYVWELAESAINNEKNDNDKNVNEKLDDIEYDNDDVSTKDSKDDDEDEDDFDINDVNSKSYDAITLAFEKKRSNERKTWLLNYNKNNIIENHSGNITVSDFINKDLIHFSNYDNIRSIPSLCDGFKPSLRKILYASLKRKIENEEIKVAQLGAYVAEKTDYHHGENSLYGAIIGMAQDFVGSNNINLLQPIGNFGSRRKGGDDSASPRYIFTKLSSLTKLLFKEEDDPILLKQYEDDNEANNEIEPEYYCPILPLILINGACGIGTGFSTYIPSFNPKDVAENILKMLDGKEPIQIHPWYRGFRGKIQKIINDKNKNDIKYQTFGTYEVIDENMVRITELPVGEWTEYYEEKLKEFLIEDKKKGATSKKFLTEIQNNSGNNTVNIEITFYGKSLQTMIKNGTFEKDLKLSTSISLSNMYLYNKQGLMCKYDFVEDIFYDFYTFRIEVYKQRKNYMIKHLENKMKILKYKVQFIEDYTDDKIILKKKSGDEVLKRLVELNYPKLSNNAFASENDKNYTYLTSMEIWSLTKEKILDLNKLFDKSKEEYEDYLKTPVEEIWRKEILVFLEKYDKWLNNINEEMNEDKISKKSNKNLKIKIKGKSPSKKNN